MSVCTCDVKPPRHEFAHGREMIGKYAVRVDQWEDDTVFDPACPFHGNNGTMVARLSAAPALDDQHHPPDKWDYSGGG